MSDWEVVSDHGVIATRKTNEFVKVQIVRIGDTGTPWAEARVNFVDRTGDLRGTKSAITFNDVADIEAFIEALTELKDAFAATTGEGTAAPEAPKFTVRKPVVGQGAAVKRAQRRKTA